MNDNTRGATIKRERERGGRKRKKNRRERERANERTDDLEPEAGTRPGSGCRPTGVFFVVVVVVFFFWNEARGCGRSKTDETASGAVAVLFMVC